MTTGINEMSMLQMFRSAWIWIVQKM